MRELKINNFGVTSRVSSVKRTSICRRNCASRFGGGVDFNDFFFGRTSTAYMNIKGKAAIGMNKIFESIDQKKIELRIDNQ